MYFIQDSGDSIYISFKILFMLSQINIRPLLSQEQACFRHKSKLCYYKLPSSLKKLGKKFLARKKAGAVFNCCRLNSSR